MELCSGYMIIANTVIRDDIAPLLFVLNWLYFTILNVKHEVRTFLQIFYM